MIFTETALSGAFVIAPERREDERGFFARIWCADELAANGLSSHLLQSSISFNNVRGTLRGMHWQAEPHGETKIVRCSRGAIFDVIVDLRPESPTYLRSVGLELSDENRLMLYIPRQFAHGFLTLTDSSELVYQMDAVYHPDSQRGARWNDPAFGIAWPFEPNVISERDKSFPDFPRETSVLRG